MQKRKLWIRPGAAERIAAAAFILLLVGLTSCDSPKTDGGTDFVRGAGADIPPEPEDEKVGTFEGRYVSGFETSSFEPCSHPGERWWVAGDLQPVDNFIRAQGRDPVRQNTSLFVKWSGRASVLGRYGHLGGYQRQFFLTRVHEIRQFTDSDCPKAEE